MLPLDVVVQAGLDPAASHAAERALIDAVERATRPAVLRVWTLAGEVVGLGRYHLAPQAGLDSRVSVNRRRTGGRVAPLGEGFAGIALTLPHRSALVASDPFALRPEQALNRFVRGLLGALRAFGVDAFYPGRDLITVGGRLLGAVGLVSEATGVTVFEACLAVGRDWSCLPARIEALDREGVVLVERLRADQTTALARHAARKPTPTELAHAVGGALAREFGVTPRSAACEDVHADAAAFAAWLGERRRWPRLDRHALGWGQIGAFEAYLSLDADGCIEQIVLAGDFLADAASVADLEARLRGCPLRVKPIAAIVRDVYADPRRFLLGIGPLDTVAETIAEAR